MPVGGTGGYGWVWVHPYGWQWLPLDKLKKAAPSVPPPPRIPHYEGESKPNHPSEYSAPPPPSSPVAK